MTTQIEKLRSENEFVFALVGNPNVGKSTIFSSLTSMYIETANYPGKTVNLNIASTEIVGVKVGLVDLPGTYSLGAVSDDQWVARQALLDYDFDAVIYILDATNITRNLYMLLQLIDNGFPVVAALNLTDEAVNRGIYIDKNKLSDSLGIDIVETVATRGIGLEKLVGRAVRLAKSRADMIRRGVLHCSDRSRPVTTRKTDSNLEEAEERNTRAQDVASECQIVSVQYRYKETKLFNFITHPFWGTAVLVLVLFSVFAVLYYAGAFLSGAIDSFWQIFIYTRLDNFLISLFGAFWGKILNFAFNDGILAVITIGIPYVLVFYLMLAFLEDTGYLNIAAFLLDKLMHKVGLHGRASIILIAGFGCNVPAIMGLKVLSTTREKTIAAFLVTLIPCSARTAVIMGAVSLFIGPFWALSVFLISFFVTFLSGYFLNKILKGKTYGLVMEISDLRTPSLKIILNKTWHRFKDFVFVAIPIILAGSIALGLLYQTGFIWYFAKPMKFVVQDLLGLPAAAGLTLIFAVMRKELALVFLVALAAIHYGDVGARCNVPLLDFMTKQQLYVFVIVNTLYIPCLAAISVLIKEIGLRRTIYITVSTILLAIATGTAARFAIGYFHLMQ